MKKMILTMVAMFSMTMAFAEGENVNSVNNLAAYDMSCNMNKLAEALSLTGDQREAVDNIYQTFTAEMMFAAQYYSNDQRNEMVKKAINKNIAWMNYVLNEKQRRTYLMLLNTTINNRGLNK
jgi:phosphoenolpyruvate carboxylase